MTASDETSRDTEFSFWGSLLWKSQTEEARCPHQPEHAQRTGGGSTNQATARIDGTVSVCRAIPPDTAYTWSLRTNPAASHPSRPRNRQQELTSSCGEIYEHQREARAQTDAAQFPR